MTLDVLVGAAIALFVTVVGKIIWDYLQSGRTKQGEFYMTEAACETCRQNCCVTSIKTTLAEHIKVEAGQDSEVKQRLINIEQRIKEAREDNAKIKDEVGGIRSALDKMVGMFEGYVKRSDERDRRTDGQVKI